MVDGVQHNLRASARMQGERMAMRVGPITVQIVQPLHILRVTVDANDGPLACDLTIVGRHFPIEEPRFTRRNGTRLFMDFLVGQFGGAETDPWLDALDLPR